MTANIRTSRKPRLKVIGREREHARRVLPLDFSTGTQVLVEAYTEADVATMPAWEKSDVTRLPFMPGVGWFRVLLDPSKEAWDDAVDIATETRNRHREMRGLEAL